MAPASLLPPLPEDPPGVPLEAHRSCPVIARLLDDDAARAWLAPLSVHGGDCGGGGSGDGGPGGGDSGSGGFGQGRGAEGGEAEREFGGGECVDEPAVTLSLEAFEAATAVSVVVRTADDGEGGEEGTGGPEGGGEAAAGSGSVTLHCLVRRGVGAWACRRWCCRRRRSRRPRGLSRRFERSAFDLRRCG